MKSFSSQIANKEMRNLQIRTLSSVAVVGIKVNVQIRNALDITYKRNTDHFKIVHSPTLFQIVICPDVHLSNRHDGKYTHRIQIGQFAHFQID